MKKISYPLINYFSVLQKQITFLVPLLIFGMFLPIFSCDKDDDNNNQQTGTVTDYDGNVYKTVKIGNQWWMAENLRTTHYADGTPIKLIEDGSSWNSISDSEKAYCYPQYDTNVDKKYGMLYTWTAATNGEGYSSDVPSNIQGVSPEGWHIPSEGEWEQLKSYLGGEEVAGGKMKEIGMVSWKTPNTDATNESGFNALPAGRTGYMELGQYVYFWSTNESCFPCGPGAYWLSYNSSYFYYGGPLIGDGCSVRCIKDTQ